LIEVEKTNVVEFEKNSTELTKKMYDFSKRCVLVLTIISLDHSQYYSFSLPHPLSLLLLRKREGERKGKERIYLYENFCMDMSGEKSTGYLKTE
jgi:hypothetical protein